MVAGLQIPDLTVTMGDVTCCVGVICCNSGTATATATGHGLKDDADVKKATDITEISQGQVIKDDVKAIEDVRKQFKRVALKIKKRVEKVPELMPVIKPREVAKLTEEKNHETVKAYHVWCAKEYETKEMAAVITAFAGTDLVHLYKKGAPLLGSDTEAVKTAALKLVPIIEDIKLVIMGIKSAALVDIESQRKNNATRIADPLDVTPSTKTKKKSKSKKAGVSSSIIVVDSSKKKGEFTVDSIAKVNAKIGALFLDAVLRVQLLSASKGFVKHVLQLKAIRQIHTIFQNMEGVETIDDALDCEQLTRYKVLQIIHFAQVVHKVSAKIFILASPKEERDHLLGILEEIKLLKDEELKLILPVNTVVIDVSETTSYQSSS